MPGTTDTKKAKVPLGSFIMNYGSSKMYPELEPLARMFSADKDDMSRTQNVILTNGEIYFPPDAVEAIGVEKLEYMNNKSKDGAHDAIDKEMAMNLLKSIKPMYGGGRIMPMGTGGMLDNYAGGGSIMNQYAGGGNVYNYADGGKVKKNLKPVPKDNPGLAKLPEAVRNKMGYMKEGGKVLPAFMKAIDSRDARSVLTQFSEFPEMAVQGIYEMNEPSGRGKRYYFGKGQVPRTRVPDLEKASAMALINAIQSQQESPQDSIPLSSVLQMLRDPEVKGDKQSIDGMKHGGMVQDSLMGMMGGGMADKKKKMYSYQDGGPIGPPLPPEMMGQAMNQQLSDSIDMRMANPEVYQGSTLGAVRNQAMMLQDSIEQDTVNKARNSLKLMALIDSLKQAGAGESVDYMPMRPMPSTKADSMRVRDLMEFLNMQQMQRGMGSVKQGMGDEPMRLLR